MYTTIIGNCIADNVAQQSSWPATSTVDAESDTLDKDRARLLSSPATSECSPALIQSGGGNRPFEARQPAFRRLVPIPAGEQPAR
jgi:hypothetical protein